MSPHYRGDDMSHLQYWGTPHELFDTLHKRWTFDLDVCAQPWSAKCSNYFTEDEDGLLQSWAGRKVWCNPPYAEPLAWLERGWLHALEHATEATYLLPNSTDTKWFQDMCFRGDIYFVRGRLKFEPPPDYEPPDPTKKIPGAPFGVVVVRFTPELAHGHVEPGCWLMDRAGKAISHRRGVQGHLF